MTSKSIVCILGMHRSGTSLVARILNLLGVSLGPEKNLLPANFANPKGYWEHQGFIDLNDRILAWAGGSYSRPPTFPVGWDTAPSLEHLRASALALIHLDFADAATWGWKDPRTCLTLPFWQHLLPSMRYVLCFRNPSEVVGSLQHRDKFSFARGVYLWLTYARSILEYTADRPRCITCYEDLLEDWQEETRALASFLSSESLLDRPEVQRAVSEFIDKDLRHHHSRQHVPDKQGKFDREEQALDLAHQVYGCLREDRASSPDVERLLRDGLSILAPAIRGEQEQQVMKAGSHADALGEGLPAGAAHYRAFVGPPDNYDLVAAMQFHLLTFLGLREHHSLLDVGCGSLRAGRLFIPYLLPGKYCGIEPEQWLIEEGVKNNIGADLLRIKQPSFRNDAGFDFAAFGRTFDYVLAQSVFSHASEGQIKKCLAEAKQVMAPGGLFAATFVRGGTNYTGTEWVYPDCVSYTEAHFFALVAGQGLAGRILNWPHPSGQTWVAIGQPQSLARIPALLSNSEFLSEIADLYRRWSDPPWEEMLSSALEDLTGLGAGADRMILVDEEQLRPRLPATCRAIPFLERDGEYWGRPLDDGTALQEFERLRRSGASFIAFLWPAFWWLDYYAEFHRHLRSSFRCVLENERLVVFDLRAPAGDGGPHG